MQLLQGAASGKREGMDAERVRGVVIHALLATLSRGEQLPSVQAVQGALYREGIGQSRAKDLAVSILDEVELCTKEERCAWFLRPDHPESYTELNIEDVQAGRIMRSGTIDRLIFDGNKWWIVDYKTARLDMTDQEHSIKEQAALHRYQMESYREMVSHTKGVCPDDINLLLYFTSIQRGFLCR
jgi:ATP-dependent exoDNAse (exonuclease V) beta subunit